MIGRILGALALGLLASALEAQTLAEVTAPINPPPASFTGQQFIDARGCVFVRAGFGGQVAWVPRIDARKRPICTGAQQAPARVASAAPRMQVAPEPQISFVAPSRALPVPPKGWKRAWTDGRLNPNRGLGTVAGEAAQDRLWTREVPMTFKADLPQKEAPKARVAVSTMSGGGIYVQIGAFGATENVEAALARVGAMGFGGARQGAGALTAVLAGPFASREAALDARASLRAAGFAGAFLR
jgi:cell division protein FtsN